MSRELIESIISNNMLEANDMVEAKLAEIRERKIYEMKRMFAAKMNEAKKDPNEPETWTGGRRAGPEFDAFLARNRAKYEKSQRAKSGAGGAAPGGTEAPKTKAKRKAPPKSEAPKPQEKVERDWKTSAKMGLRRTGTRLAYGAGYPLGRAIGLGKKALDVTKKAISDPIPAAGAVAKTTAKTSAKVATHVGKKIASAPVTQDIKDIGFRNL